MADTFKNRARRVWNEIPKGKASYKVPLVVAGFLVGIAFILDCFQFLLDLTVLGAPFAFLVGFLASCFFFVAFGVMRVNFFAGRHAGIIIATAFISLVIELVPFLDALPGITIGVITVIYYSRKRDEEEAVIKAEKAQREAKMAEVADAQRRFDYGEKVIAALQDRKALEQREREDEEMQESDEEDEEAETAVQKSRANADQRIEEQLKANEFVVPESDLGKARMLLRSAGVGFADRQYSERELAGGSTWQSAEFVITIKNDQGSDETYPEKIRSAFRFLRDNGTAVRYGQAPSRVN
ncbi:MAG: hypothetical protein V4480_01690 [Patescibacteria group bacterium]